MSKILWLDQSLYYTYLSHSKWQSLKAFTGEAVLPATFILSHVSQAFVGETELYHMSGHLDTWDVPFSI